MEQVIRSATSNKQFMGAVLVARGGRIVLDKGYGLANLEWGIPNGPHVRFRVGSVTKQFTAVSILLLQERGKLRIEDPVRNYLPDAPAAWDGVTIFNLLTHTSGIPNFTDFADYAATEAIASSPQELVARFRDRPLDFQPGQQFKYSNSGYVLLGYLIERISGQRYADFVAQNLFEPLGMKDSGYDSNSTVIARRASGYAPGATSPVNAGYINMSIPFAAGALYSSTEDLLRWEQGLFGGRVLSKASVEKMLTPFKNDYALGLKVHTVAGYKVIEHRGEIEGFSAFVAYYPQDELEVIVLANLSGPASEEIATALAGIAHGNAARLSVADAGH